MTRRIAWLLGAAVTVGLLFGLGQAAPPSDASTLYVAHLQCSDLCSGECMPQCTVEPAARGIGWAQAYIDGDRLVIHGAYDGLSAPIDSDLALGVHVHHDPADYHVDTLVRGLTNEGGTSGLFHGSFTLTPQYRVMLETGRMYIDIHTSATGKGELQGMLMPVAPSGQAAW